MLAEVFAVLTAFFCSSSPFITLGNTQTEENFVWSQAFMTALLIYLWMINQINYCGLALRVFITTRQYIKKGNRLFN